MPVVFNHAPLRLERLVSVPAITIAADFTDYSFTVSHEYEGFQYVHFWWPDVFLFFVIFIEKRRQNLKYNIQQCCNIEIKKVSNFQIFLLMKP